jgi:hypothetical protein
MATKKIQLKLKIWRQEGPDHKGYFMEHLAKF